MTLTSQERDNSQNIFFCPAMFTHAHDGKSDRESLE